MNKRFKNFILISTIGLVLMHTAQAATPLWTYAQVSGYPPSVTLSTVETATIQYTVTNQSHKPHTLQMKPIRGITPSGCTTSLGYHQTCTLMLTVNGSKLRGDIFGGPVLCDQGNSYQCYQPTQANSLAIHLTSAPPIQYTIISSAGSNGTINPSTPQTVYSGTTLTFTATPDTGYGVTQWLVDGNLAQTGGNTYQLNVSANHTVEVSFGTVTLAPSVAALALSINCQPASSCAATQNAALTGNPRQITIQNLGSGSATNVSVNTSGLPLGTSISSNTCTGTLNGGSSCIITLTPGSVASSDCTLGTSPVAGTVTITADGSPSTQVDAYVLGYGCQYQGGFLYAIDDSYPSTSSIGGKVVSLVDQAEPYTIATQPTSIIWSSNGNGSTFLDVDYTTILGIDQTSTISTPSPTSPPYPPGTPVYTACNGSTDGACNSGNIVSYYNFNRISGGSAPTPVTYYAAGLCTATINTYSDWYLPATCEMDAVNGACPVGTQSMVESLTFLIGDPFAPTPNTSCTPPLATDCLAGTYWSSTELSFAPQTIAFTEYFSSVGSGPSNVSKNEQLGVRCSRALTP